MHANVDSPKQQPQEDLALQEVEPRQRQCQHLSDVVQLGASPPLLEYQFNALH